MYVGVFFNELVLALWISVVVTFCSFTKIPKQKIESLYFYGELNYEHLTEAFCNPSAICDIGFFSFQFPSRLICRLDFLSFLCYNGGQNMAGMNFQ